MGNITIAIMLVLPCLFASSVGRDGATNRR